MYKLDNLKIDNSGIIQYINFKEYSGDSINSRWFNIPYPNYWDQTNCFVLTEGTCGDPAVGVQIQISYNRWSFSIVTSKPTTMTIRVYFAFFKYDEKDINNKVN